MVYLEQKTLEVRTIETTGGVTRDITFPAQPVSVLLVLDIIATTATAVGITQSGWVALTGGGNTSASQTRRYVKASDGSETVVTITSPNVTVHTLLTGWNGWAGGTDYSSIFSQGAAASTGTMFPYSGFESAGTKSGIALSFVGLATNPASWTGWSAQTPIPATAAEANGSRFWHAAADYVNDAPDTTLTWSGSRAIRYLSSIIPLNVVPVGPTPADAVGVTDTVTVVEALARSAADAVGVTDSVSAELTSGLIANPADPVGVSDLVAVTVASLRAPADQVDVTDAVAAVLTPAGGTGRSVPTQAEMPVDPFTDFAPTPTYAWSTSSGPMGAPYQWLPADSPFIRLAGGAARGVVAGESAGFVRPAILTDIAGAGSGSNAMVVPPYDIAVGTDSQDVWVRLLQRSYSGMTNVSPRASARVTIDGKWTQDAPLYLGSPLGYPTNPQNITAGEYYLHITLADGVTMRDVEITTHLSFGGIAVNAGATIQVPAAKKHRLYVADGSLPGGEKHQTGNFALDGTDGSGAPATYTGITSHIWYAGYALAYDEIVNGATGSTGYGINGDTVKINSAGKLAEIVAFNPDTFVLANPNNDIQSGRSTTEVGADLDSIMGTVRSAIPAVLGVVFGGITPPAMGSQAAAEAIVAPYNVVIKAKAQLYGFWFINPATGQTYDPDGVLRSTTSNWVYQVPTLIASDGGHPIQRGSKEIGVLFAAAFREAHAEGTQDYTANPADTITVTDAVVAAQGRTAIPADQVGAVDVVAAESAVQRSSSDSLTITDLAAVTQGLVESLVDPVGLSDTAMVTLIAAVAYGDAVAVTDGASAVGNAVRTLTDALSITDGVVVDLFGSSVATPSDSAGITDTVIISSTADRVASDPVAATDVVTTALSFPRHLTDTVSANDAAAVTLSIQRIAADAVAVTDSVIADLAGTGTVTVSDTVAGTDTVSASNTAVRVSTDAVSASDWVTSDAGASREPTEQVAVTDSIGIVRNGMIALADAVFVTDVCVFILTSDVMSNVPARRQLTGGITRTLTGGAVRILTQPKEY